MAYLKIHNFNKVSDKFLFKKRLTLRRKSKQKLINETLVMLFFSILIIYINYLILNKVLVVKNVFDNFGKLIANIFELLTYSYKVSLAIFVFASLIFALILVLGAISRIIKIIKGKSRQISIK